MAGALDSSNSGIFEASNASAMSAACDSPPSPLWPEEMGGTRVDGPEEIVMSPDQPPLSLQANHFWQS